MRPKGRTKLLIYIIAMFSLIFISFHSPVLEQLESDLGNHMIIEHALFLSIGYLSIMVSESILKVVFNKRKKVSEYGVRQSTGIQALINCWTSFVRSLYTITRNGLFPMACAIIIVIFWHMPSIFDLSLYNQSIHIVQHLLLWEYYFS
jgi:cytochrome c oxidase assembly factor CtaG